MVIVVSIRNERTGCADAWGRGGGGGAGAQDFDPRGPTRPHPRLPGPLSLPPDYPADSCYKSVQSGAALFVGSCSWEGRRLCGKPCVHASSIPALPQAIAACSLQPAHPFCTFRFLSAQSSHCDGCCLSRTPRAGGRGMEGGRGSVRTVITPHPNPEPYTLGVQDLARVTHRSKRPPPHQSILLLGILTDPFINL